MSTLSDNKTLFDCLWIARTVIQELITLFMSYQFTFAFKYLIGKKLETQNELTNFNKRVIFSVYALLIVNTLSFMATILSSGLYNLSSVPDSDALRVLFQPVNFSTNFVTLLGI